MWLTHIIFKHRPDFEFSLITVLAKGNYSFDHEQPSQQIPIKYPFYDADECLEGDDPQISPLIHESDLVSWKPKIDLIIHGHAWAPTGKKARYLDAGIALGDQIRQVRVIGNRTVDASGFSLRFTEPEPFEKMPLHYGLAYGGCWKQHIYPRNPVGKGFVISTDRKDLHGLELPNLEDIRMLLTPQNIGLKRYDRWKEMPHPKGFGWLPRQNINRMQAACMGKQETHNGSAPEMQFAEIYPQMPITLAYLDPAYPRFKFLLPKKFPQCLVEMGQWQQEAALMPQTIEIFKPVNEISIVFALQLKVPTSEFKPEDSHCQIIQAN